MPKQIKIEDFGYNLTFQYRIWRYKSEKGEISLVSPSWLTFFKWEIYCIKGNLFEDVERFSTKQEAEQRIKELLCQKGKRKEE